MALAALAEVAREVFGEDRVTVAADLPDAIDRAVALAEANGLGGSPRDRVGRDRSRGAAPAGGRGRLTRAALSA